MPALKALPQARSEYTEENAPDGGHVCNDSDQGRPAFIRLRRQEKKVVEFSGQRRLADYAK